MGWILYHAQPSEQSRQRNEAQCPFHGRTMFARMGFVNAPERLTILL
jgi:hypothetical protein